MTIIMRPTNLEHKPSFIEQRRALCCTPCTLDGKPATVCGALLDYAVVRSLDGLRGAEFSWTANKRILSKGGKFKSA